MNPNDERSNLRPRGLDASESPDSEVLSSHALFDILAAPARAKILSLLVRCSNPIETETLTRVVALEDKDGVVDASSVNERERVAAALHHTHLPKLSKVGLVKLSPKTDEVKLIVSPDELEPYLALTDVQGNNTSHE
ncbi:DUF7344 domain-containing protein [Halegenticoccus soli]|uniref:DUF7344 domain-containing protein n=1 Tax=Halegenticoccus soli TaxID=1985678 RepID=UPI00117B89F0|nr:hypothetical protein [Halegenticoccus soli]